MNARPGVTLQINLAPTDLPCARYTLPHQLKQWAGQVDEIVLVVDLHRSRGRYSAAWNERLPGMRSLIADCCAQYPHARSADVDYGEEMAACLSSTFFGGKAIPAKNWNGAPYYAYVFGLQASQHRYVLHMDSDMMYGGGSQTWVAEAVRLLQERPDILACNPLPGPPTADGHLRSQALEPEPLPTLAFRAHELSTRIFLADMERFHSTIPCLTVLQPPRYRIVQGMADGNPPYCSFEDTLSRGMDEHGLVRIDFLGRDPGMWSLHPPYRSALFYELLPTLVHQVETGDIPDGQRGDHDMNDSMVDWSSARKSLPSRALKHVRLAMSRPFRHM